MLRRSSWFAVQRRTTGFNPVLGFLSASTQANASTVASAAGFNPVLGFLSASTASLNNEEYRASMFQSRSGFSECFDRE